MACPARASWRTATVARHPGRTRPHRCRRRCRWAARCSPPVRPPGARPRSLRPARPDRRWCSRNGDIPSRRSAETGSACDAPKASSPVGFIRPILPEPPVPACLSRPFRRRRSRTSARSSCGAEPRPSGEIAVITDRLEGSVPDQHLRRAQGLDLGVLHRQQAARTQQPSGGDHHLADGVESVDPGEQGHGGIMIASLGCHRGEGLERDVGRVGDHQIDRRRSVRAVRSSSPRRAGSRRCSRGCDRPRARASSEISTACTCACGTSVARALATAPDPVPRSTASGWSPRSHHLSQAIDGPAGHHLGLGPRHEDSRPHHQLQVPEVGTARQMLQRDPLRPAGDETLELGAEIVVHRLLAVEVARFAAEAVRQQHPRVGGGAVHTDRPEPFGRRGEKSRYRTGARQTDPAEAASRSAVSASSRAVITACRSPLRTWSRL